MSLHAKKSLPGRDVPRAPAGFATASAEPDPYAKAALPMANSDPS